MINKQWQEFDCWEIGEKEVRGRDRWVGLWSFRMIIEHKDVYGPCLPEAFMAEEVLNKQVEKITHPLQVSQHPHAGACAREIVQHSFPE